MNPHRSVPCPGIALAIDVCVGPPKQHHMTMGASWFEGHGVIDPRRRPRRTYLIPRTGADNVEGLRQRISNQGEKHPEQEARDAVFQGMQVHGMRLFCSVSLTIEQGTRRLATRSGRL